MYMKSLIPLEKDFLVIYLDTRGAGRSEAPAKASGYAFSHFLDDLETLRLHLRLDRWLIFAHSDASLQAMAYSIEHPKVTRGLFIANGTLNIDDKELRADTRARMRKLCREPWFAAANNAAGSNFKSDEEFKQSFLHVQLPLYFASYHAAMRARRYFSASTYHVIANKYDDYAPKFPAKKLAEIRAPTAVFEGDRDVITTPLEALRLERGIANSTLFMIRKAGHFPWLERRGTFFRDFVEAARIVLGQSR
jgi:proline iminopeptidase